MCVICLFALITVFAAAEDYSVTASSGFTVAYYGEDMAKAAKIMGLSEKELKTLCRENDVQFVAVNADNSVQIRLSRYQTELSKKTEDLSSLSDSLVEELFSDIGENKYVKATLGNTVFFKMTENLSDSGGNYVSDQYVTVKNGYVYLVSVYRAESADTEAAEAFLQGIRINRTVIFSNKQKILVASAIAVLVILIGFMVRGIIKDVRIQKRENEQ